MANEGNIIVSAHALPTPNWFGLNKETLEFIARLPKNKRMKAMRAVGVAEWDKCHQSIFYWLDASQHMPTEKFPDGLPYVFTHDPHQAFACTLCEEPEVTYTFDKLELHLQMRHNIAHKDYDAIVSYFEELPAIRPFPYTQPYIKPIIECWLRERYMFVVKSRDMLATWTMVMMYTWDTLYNDGAQNIFQSLNAKKALDLTQRAWVIYKNQPKVLRDVHPAAFTQGTLKGGELMVPSINTILMGFPQDPDQIRQFHPRGLFQDEAAFLPSAAASFGAAKPTIQNGGRFSAISSANPGWFEAAVCDLLDGFAN